MRWWKRFKKVPENNNSEENKNKTDMECYHDWELIENKSNEYYKVWSSYIGLHSTIYNIHKTSPSLWKQPAHSIVWPENTVCLKCGECDNQADRWKRKYHNDIKEKRRRKIWAKQLWEDGCKK